MDGTDVESAFALLLTKVTKPPYPAKISFYEMCIRDRDQSAWWMAENTAATAIKVSHIWLANVMSCAMKQKGS